MRVLKHHAKIITDAVQTRMKQHPEINAKYYTDNGCTEEQFRWDLFQSCANSCMFPEGFLTETLYSYCNDNNIDTVLRKATGTK